MSNDVNRLFAAVLAMAAHGNIKQRLIQAYEENLADIEVDELPPAIRQPFVELRDCMNRVEPLNGEGAISASVRKMSIVEADECARHLVELYGNMIRVSEDTQEVLPLQVDERTVVPPFLIKSG